MFSLTESARIAKGLITRRNPVYVQFYVTARCNLTCQQCNIIYANSDLPECSLDDIQRIADNFAKLGVAIVLLTGGEPFARKDLPEIIKAFRDRDIHVRMQTNGLAREEEIHRAIEFGGNDISISLDSLDSGQQDAINGGFDKSWHSALRAVSLFTKYLPREDSFASFGCVMQRNNLEHIPDVIRFGTEIGWYTSLVPIHTTNQHQARGFRTFDQNLAFIPSEFDAVAKLLKQVHTMRENGYLLYDSDQYLDDIYRFVSGEATTWRSKNNQVCDSPSLYFALLPNGEFAPCCDHRLPVPIYAQSKSFPQHYRNRSFKRSVVDIAKSCEGCMYGSYPEISISSRFMAARIQRAKQFFVKKPSKNWPFSYDDLTQIGKRIREENPLPYA
ncbi:radical SAM protein [Pelagicoccus mobilis]|uniref:Radical SAM protein n=1 Tax=Pelagicoccus mobilis TaxID=415221 RepID=A0A934S1P0_9BACT|nr:radical SAM protein [Pelagicoccus mobilis]MBK1878232.1 radical SAM protein [Pelagicoccus mobilis]